MGIQGWSDLLFAPSLTVWYIAHLDQSVEVVEIEIFNFRQLSDVLLELLLCIAK